MAELMTENITGELYQYYPLGEYVVRAIGCVRWASDLQIHPD